MENNTPSKGPSHVNAFEKVDSVQSDAMTLELVVQEDIQVGIIHCPAIASGGRLPKDFRSKAQPAKETFRAAIKMANDFKVAIVVLDDQGLWQEEWGQLYLVADEDA
jgi:hypothetical protein